MICIDTCTFGENQQRLYLVLLGIVGYCWVLFGIVGSCSGEQKERTEPLKRKSEGKNEQRETKRATIPLQENMLSTIPLPLHAPHNLRANHRVHFLHVFAIF